MLKGTETYVEDTIEFSKTQVVLSSAQGFTTPLIARLVGMSVDYVRTLIHQFNSNSMEMLGPKWQPTAATSSQMS